MKQESTLNNMNVLLTGATGFLGSRTIEKLVNEPYINSIIATGRVQKNFLEHPKVTYILGDLTNASFAHSLVSQVDSIIHAAALSAPWGSYESFIDANLRIQQHLIHAAKKHQIQRYIFISTPTVYFNGKHQLNIKETDPLPKKLINDYSTTKRLAEIELEQSGIPYITLRPRALIGRGDTVIMPRLIRAFDEKKLKIIGDGNNLVDLTPVSNVVDAILLSLATTSSKAINQTYNISNGEPVKLWEQIRLVLNLLNRKLSNRKIPYQIAHILAQFLEWNANFITKKEPALTVYSVGVLAKSFTMDISKAQEKLGYQPNMTTNEAIQEFVNWYKQQ